MSTTGQTEVMTDIQNKPMMKMKANLMSITSCQSATLVSINDLQTHQMKLKDQDSVAGPRN